MYLSLSKLWRQTRGVYWLFRTWVKYFLDNLGMTMCVHLFGPKRKYSIKRGNGLPWNFVQTLMVPKQSKDFGLFDQSCNYISRLISETIDRKLITNHFDNRLNVLSLFFVLSCSCLFDVTIFVSFSFLHDSSLNIFGLWIVDRDILGHNRDVGKQWLLTIVNHFQFSQITQQIYRENSIVKDALMPLSQ